MEDLNQLKLVLVKKKKNNKWLAEQLGVNEATRVQMPAMVHLTRLGYSYFGKISEDMAGTVYDPATNILRSIRQELKNDDLGKPFYKRLQAVPPIKLIDFENPQSNTFHFTAEFTCKNGQDEFRPDITLFANGLPLCFVEVKKPNYHRGIVAESKRMNDYKTTLAQQFAESHRLEDEIMKQLGSLSFNRNVGKE